MAQKQLKAVDCCHPNTTYFLSNPVGSRTCRVCGGSLQGPCPCLAPLERCFCRFKAYLIHTDPEQLTRHCACSKNRGSKTCLVSCSRVDFKGQLSEQVLKYARRTAKSGLASIFSTCPSSSPQKRLRALPQSSEMLSWTCAMKQSSPAENRVMNSLVELQVS